MIVCFMASDPSHSSKNAIMTWMSYEPYRQIYRYLEDRTAVEQGYNICKTGQEYSRRA